MDAFTPERLARVHERLKPPRTMIRDTFFTESDTFNETAVRVDVVDTKRRMVPFASPLGKGTPIRKTGYVSRLIEPAYVKPLRTYTPAELRQRAPGQGIQNSGTDRLQRLVNRDLQEMNDMYTLREEWMCIQALVNGTVDIQGDGVNQTVDFGFLAEQQVTPATPWTDQANADPLDDLETARLLIARMAGLTGSVAIMGRTAYSNFIRNAMVQKLLDLLRLQVGSVDVDEMPEGVTYVGNFLGNALRVYVYDAWFVDPTDDTEKALFPENKVLVGAPAARCVRNYGAIQDLSASGMGQLIARRSFPKSWLEQNPSLRHLVVQGAPLPTPIENYAFVTLTVA